MNAKSVDTSGYALIEHVKTRIAHSLAEANLPHNTPLVIAYSGGVDSSVLFHAAVHFRDLTGSAVHAVHVHHGLSANADAWARHCELQCRLNDVHFHLSHVNVVKESRSSLEAQARKARYKALLQVCREQEGVLLLGQHAEDQLETVLLQLKRGAGPQGLAGMGEATFRDDTLVIRPMLSLEKQDIVQFALDEDLRWVEDESNAQNSFDRNFLRNDIIPQLIARWPKLAKTVSRSAELCAEQSALLNDTAQQQLQLCLIADDQLNGDALSSLTPSWQANVLRAWFAKHGELPPSKAQTGELLKMLTAKVDATPEVCFKWGKVARFQRDFYWVPTPVAQPQKSIIISDGKKVDLPWLDITLTVTVKPHVQHHPEIRLETNKRSLKVKPETANVSKSIKDWFKVWRVPLWERDKVPVLLVDETPVALILHKKLVWFEPMAKNISVSIHTMNGETI